MKSALLKIENFSRHMDTKMKWQLKKNCSFWTFTLWKFSPSNISISAEHWENVKYVFIEEQNRLSFISFPTFTTDARSKNLNRPKLFLNFSLREKKITEIGKNDFSWSLKNEECLAVSSSIFRLDNLSFEFRKFKTTK